MSFYSQRPPIPKQIVNQVSPEGQLEGEVMEKRISRDAIVREVEVGVCMNVVTAKAVVEWLNEKIGVAEKISSEKPLRKERRQKRKG